VYTSCSSGGVCSGSGNNRTITFATIPGGGTATAQITATPACTVRDGTPILNQASVSGLSAPAEAVLMNNSGQVSITALNPPPSLSAVTPSSTVLRPPNHKMVDVTLGYTVTDNCGLAACSVTVSSNEPVNGTGDGDTAPDWEILSATHIRLRAERAGSGGGRIYTISVTCTDTGGARATRSAQVLVPVP
jgi:hypothetical protein